MFKKKSKDELTQNEAVNVTGAVKVKKKIYKRWWFWVIVVVVIGIAAVSGGSGGGSSAGNESTDTVSANDESVNTESSAATETKSNDEIVQALREDFYKAVKTKENGLDVKYDENSKKCDVTYEVSDEWTFLDWNDFVRTNVSDYIDFCRTAFDNTDIDTIYFDIHYKGASNFTLCTDKKSFEKYDWSELEYENILGTLQECCSEFTMLQFIIDEMDEDEVYYDPMN